MAVRFLILIIFMVSTSLFAQDAIAQPDSVTSATAVDSSIVRTLAAPTAADSLEAARLRAAAAAQIAKAEVDTLNLTQGMHNAITTSLNLQNLMPFPYLMHRENNHYFAPLSRNICSAGTASPCTPAW